MSTKRVYIIHRWGGSPTDDFYPSIKEALEQEGIDVFLPQMPNSDSPTLETWIPSMLQLINRADEHTSFIGHSIGCQAILRYLETVSNQIGGMVLVAPWFKLQGLTEDEEIFIKPWVETPIDFDKLRRTVPAMTALFSSNDPYVAINDNKSLLEEKLNAKVLILENRGHFTKDDGISEFPELLDALFELVGRNQHSNNSLPE